MAAVVQENESPKGLITLDVEVTIGGNRAVIRDMRFQLPFDADVDRDQALAELRAHFAQMLDVVRSVLPSPPEERKAPF